MSTHLVIANKDNTVLEVFVCESAEAMEARFTKECEAFGVSPVDEHFTDGYIELEEGVTICMTHAKNEMSGTNENRSITVPITFTEQDISEILEKYNELSVDDTDITVDDLFNNQEALEYFRKELSPSIIKEEFVEGSDQGIINDWLYDLEGFFREDG